jgi:hypothetical protein
MKKILVFSKNEALKDLFKKNQAYEFEFVESEKIFAEILRGSEKNYSLLICDQILAEPNLLNLINNSNLPMISFFKEQSGLEKIYLIPKPIHITALLEKIDFLTNNQQKKIFYLRDCSINLEARFIQKTADGKIINEIKLTEIETKILEFLFSEPEEKRTKNRILKEVWNHKNADQMTDTGIVEVTINKLRKKLKEIAIDDLINFKINN